MDNNIIEIFLTILFVVVLSFYQYLIWNFRYWEKRGVNGPKPKLFYGSVKNSFKMKRNLIYEFDDVYRQYKKNEEKFAGIFMGRCPQLLLIDPKVIREVMVANFKNFHDNEISLITTDNRDPLLARNPFLSVGSAWKEKRSEVTPALTPSRIKANHPAMIDVSKRLNKYLERKCTNPPEDGFEVRELAMRFTTEVVIICIYGIEAGAFTSDEECRIIKEGNSFTIFAMSYYFLLSAFPFIRHFYKLKLVPKSTESFFINLVEDAKNLKNQEDDNRIDMLNYLLLIQKKKGLTDLDVTAHTITFFLDGFDTSAILISHCLHMIARHKSVQNKLRQEIKEAASQDGHINFDKLVELPYLDQVFNETLRLFPPIAILTKLCTIPHELSNSKDQKVLIEKNTVMIIPIYSIHRDERYYSEPDKFKPERFDPDMGGVKKYRDMGVFLPFGDGPRVCLGMRFGLAQSKTAVAEIVYNWELTVNRKTKDELKADPYRFLFHIDGGIWLDFRKICES